MITLTKFTDGYPEVHIDPEDIVAIESLNIRPFWAEGFYRDISRVHFKGGNSWLIAQTPSEIQQKISADKTGRQISEYMDAPTVKNPCQHPEIEPQLVCERCGYWEAMPDPPKYRLKVWDVGDWFELERINPGGTESPVEILGSQHNKLCAYWSIVADMGVEIEEMTVPDKEES